HVPVIVAQLLVEYCRVRQQPVQSVDDFPVTSHVGLSGSMSWYDRSMRRPKRGRRQEMPDSRPGRAPCETHVVVPPRESCGIPPGSPGAARWHAPRMGSGVILWLESARTEFRDQVRIALFH